MTTEIIEFTESGEIILPESKIFPKAVLKALQNIPNDSTKFSFKELEDIVKPSHNERKIKNSFWREFTEADKRGKVMNVTAMCGGICAPDYFYAFLKKTPYHVFWLVSPLYSYHNEIETLLEEATGRYSDLINMDIRKYVRGEPTDEVDAKKAAVLLSVIKNVEDRSMGAALQRQVAVNVNSPNVNQDEQATLDMSAIERKLKELEEQLGESDPKALDYIDMEANSAESPILEIDSDI